KRNVVRGNLVFRSRTHGIQVAADAILKDNIILESGGDGIHVQPHQGVRPGNLRIENNYVAASAASALRLELAASMAPNRSNNPNRSSNAHHSSDAGQASSVPDLLIARNTWAQRNDGVVLKWVADRHARARIDWRDNFGVGQMDPSSVAEWASLQAKIPPMPKLEFQNHPASGWLRAFRRSR
ncbi:MAG: hypothetical protein AAF958_09885, partial [Planctomycetota bacterium]